MTKVSHKIQYFNKYTYYSPFNFWVLYRNLNKCLFRFCVETATCWASSKPEVVKSSGLALRAVLTETLQQVDRDTCGKVVEELSNGLKYQYHTAWNIVLPILATLTEQVGPLHPELLYPMLRQLSELRASDNMKLEKEADFVVGKAVAAMGPSKTFEVLSYQMWSLLPGFCTYPTDLGESFKNLARILGTQLTTRKEIRLYILTGLRHLIMSSLEVVEDKAEMTRFSKNFLPILFNLYTTK